jgi:hypothetical protein
MSGVNWHRVAAIAIFFWIVYSQGWGLIWR